MKPRAFNLHPGESPSAAIGRLHRFIRESQSNYKPQSRYSAKVQQKKVLRNLHLVKG